jgi:hypothetical protein
MSLKTKVTLAIEKAFETMKSFMEPVTYITSGVADYDPDTGAVTQTAAQYPIFGFVMNIQKKPTEEHYSEADKFDLYVKQSDLSITPKIDDKVTYIGQSFRISKIEEDTAHITWALTLAEM